MFRFIGEFVAWLWRISDIVRISPIGEARIGSPLAGCLLFMVLLFFCIGAVLMALGGIFGFSLDDVDTWLAGLGPWLDFLGKILIQKVLMAIVLLICIALAASLLYSRWESGTPGLVAIIFTLLGCLMVGYCSAVNMIAPLDPYDPPGAWEEAR